MLTVGVVIVGVVIVGVVIVGVVIVGVVMVGVVIVGVVIDGVLIDGPLIEGALTLNPVHKTPNPHKIPKRSAKAPKSPKRTQQHGEQQVFFDIGSSSGAKSL